MFGGGLAVLGVASGLYIFTLAGYSTGALVGIYRLSGDVMQVFGPMAIGPVLESFGFQVSFTTMAVFGLLAMASLLLRPPHASRPCHQAREAIEHGRRDQRNTRSSGSRFR